MTRPLRLLMLEDDSADAELELATLARAGFECETRRVETREAFEEALAAGRWDAVIADYSLPAFTGTEALVIARARDPILPFILISGTLGEERALEAVRAGATDYVLKQNLARLAPALRRALAEHRARLEHFATQHALEASERRYRGIVEDQSELICRMTPGGALTFVNRAFCRYFGLAPGELVGTSFLERLPDEAHAVARDAWSNLTAANALLEVEHRANDASGRLRWQRWSVRGLLDEAGRLVEIQAVGRDVTKLATAMDALRASEARIERVLRGSIDGFWDWDLGKNRVYYSPRFREQLGFAETDSFTSEFSFQEFLHPDDAPRVLQALRRSVDDGQAFREEFRLRCTNGAHVWFFGRGERLPGADGGAPHFVGSITEITDRKRIEESLQLALERLRQLSRRVIAALENERAYLARELHDQIGQVLTAVKISVQALGRHLMEPAHRARLEDSIQAIDTGIGQVRRLSLNLRPPQLDALGLEAALRAHLQRQAEAGGFAAHFTAARLPEALDPDVQTACFRIAQEALTNILRHARARTVWVELDADAGALTLLVRDDGVGFDLSVAARRAVTGESLGLVSMEERAALAGGSLRVASAPGAGTELRAAFPLRRGPQPTGGG